MANLPNLKELVFRDTPFANLMNKRVFNVLLIATKYDAFMLEDDGRVDEQIFNEYNQLGLSYPPRFTQVTTTEEALDVLADRHFELIIVMPNMDKSDAFAAAREVKARYPQSTIVVLTPFSKEVSKRFEREDLSSIDYVFSWLGNAELLLAIIKLVEDKLNAESDTAAAGVQNILLVEDSVRFYSSALPYLYRLVLEQSREFAKEALNDSLKTMRMRGRPKILLARSYEEAKEIFDQYKENILGVISDMSFMREGKKDPLAGYRLCKDIRDYDRHIPLIMESSEDTGLSYADKVGASFISKNSKTYPQDLRREIMERFGFGDFVIIDPATRAPIMRIRNLHDLQQLIWKIPEASLTYHLSRNHFSRFFFSRAMFPPAVLLKEVDVSDYDTIDQARQLIFDLIVEYRRLKNEGVVAIYQKDRFDEYSSFARIGKGSLGGKGRGLAFMAAMVRRYPKLEDQDFSVNIPKTVVLCTDIFDEFMETNGLYPIALSDASDEEILAAFEQGHLPDSVLDDLMALFDVVHGPIAVRSSSLLEDSHYQPFAGIYATYMIPKTGDRQEMLRLMRGAIKAVYASVFYKDSKSYLTATQNVIDQEKMAIVLQEVVGNTYGGSHFYPALSGVARSLNFYPIGDERPEDGVASLALGLGKYIVDGGQTLRFSPRHPQHILQLSTPELALRETQTRFYALDLTNPITEFKVSEGFNILKLSVKDAETDGALGNVCSTFDWNDGIIRPGMHEGGRKLITFQHILQYDGFPVCRTIDTLLDIGRREMGRHVEIEFAMNIRDGKAAFFLLQMRPIVDSKEIVEEDLSLIPDEDTVISSHNVLGNGIIQEIYDVVYVKTEAFGAENNPQIAQEISRINATFDPEGTGYVLIGPGRWGSSDPWLGIPVKFPDIACAKVIVECGLDRYRIDPSQGTHFFQNLTSLGIGYFTINPFREDGYFDEAFLNAMPAVNETEHVRHVRFTHPLMVKMDGRRSRGVVLK
ncbi:MAG: phosphoenolpyruvate synthase [Alloprevotella sp.]|nr:phosphoenolpyruvate synthase [Alloprevotella sp.]